MHTYYKTAKLGTHTHTLTVMSSSITARGTAPTSAVTTSLSLVRRAVWGMPSTRKRETGGGRKGREGEAGEGRGDRGGKGGTGWEGREGQGVRCLGQAGKRGGVFFCAACISGLHFRVLPQHPHPPIGSNALT